MKKKIIWDWDYGLYVPFCPNCGDLVDAYGEVCDTCGEAFEYTEPMYKSKTVIVGDYEVVQETNNHISIYKDGQFVYHASCSKEMTEEELKQQVDFYEKISSGGFVKNGN